MTYDEARVIVTILMVADGLPAPDFSDDALYVNRQESPLGSALYWLSKPTESKGDYSGVLVSAANVAVRRYIKSRTKKP